RVHLLALVLGQQAVELVRQQVDRGVHVHAAGVGVQGAAREADGGLGAVLGLVHYQQGAHFHRLVEVAAQAGEPGLDVLVHGRGDFDFLSSSLDAHRTHLRLPWVGYSMAPKRSGAVNIRLKSRPSAATQARRTRSWEEGMFMASRYFATVRRATGMPLASSAAARRASDSGLRGSSASTRRRIMAWMAVLEAS